MSLQTGKKAPKVDKFLVKLLMRLVEALQLLKYATKKNRGISFINGLDKGEELAELELMEKGVHVEDMEGILQSFKNRTVYFVFLIPNVQYSVQRQGINTDIGKTAPTCPLFKT